MQKNTTPTTFSNHLSVHQWIHSAIHDSQQPNSPIGFLSETSATALCGTTGIHRLLGHYWIYPSCGAFHGQFRVPPNRWIVYGTYHTLPYPSTQDDFPGGTSQKPPRPRFQRHLVAERGDLPWRGLAPGSTDLHFHRLQDLKESW